MSRQTWSTIARPPGQSAPLRPIPVQPHQHGQAPGQLRQVRGQPQQPGLGGITLGVYRVSRVDAPRRSTPLVDELIELLPEWGVGDNPEAPVVLVAHSLGCQAVAWCPALQRTLVTMAWCR